jgi:hypothetical protein
MGENNRAARGSTGVRTARRGAARVRHGTRHGPASHGTARGTARRRTARGTARRRTARGGIRDEARQSAAEHGGEARGDCARPGAARPGVANARRGVPPAAPAGHLGQAPAGSFKA